MRKCPKCEMEKEDRFFPPIPADRRGGLMTRDLEGSWNWLLACLACRRHHARVAGQVRYDSVFVQQNGLCKACGEPPGARRFSKDIDDRVFLFRGLVHQRCNVVIGIARDDPCYLRSLAHYLEHAHDHRVIQPTLWKEP